MGVGKTCRMRLEWARVNQCICVHVCIGSPNEMALPRPARRLLGNTKAINKAVILIVVNDCTLDRTPVSVLITIRTIFSFYFIILVEFFF